MKRILLTIVLIITTLICFSQDSKVVVLRAYNLAMMEYNNISEDWDILAEQEVNIKGFYDYNNNVIKFYNSAETTLNLVTSVNADTSFDSEGNKSNYVEYLGFNQKGEEINVLIRAWETKDVIQVYIVRGNNAYYYDCFIE